LNDIGMSPLMMAWKKYLDDTFTLFGRSSNRVTPLIERHIENLLAARTLSDLKQPGMGGLMELWQKGLEICSATWKAEFGYSSTLLHTMAIVGGRRDVACPTIAMWLATKIRAEDLATPDHDGNTPLHLAAMYNELKTIPLHTDKQKTLRIANRPSLVLLVEAAPQVAVMRNNVGRLPVHCAIVSGKAFMNGIVQLIHANPACLNQRDSLTLLPPCLLAATVPSCRLSTAFELLRLCPEIVQQGIKQSNDEMSVE